MKAHSKLLCTAFSEHQKIASGDAAAVALQVKKFLSKNRGSRLLVFEDLTGHQIEFDLRGTEKEILTRLQESSQEESGDKAGPGRPKLGVVSREISLLPAHWDWLSLQPGGASAALRKLVHEAKKQNSVQDQVRQSQNASHKFMTAIAGNLPQYEEALRALYAQNKTVFESLIGSWPKDIREYLKKTAKPALTQTSVLK